jgi:hypothetical protein
MTIRLTTLFITAALAVPGIAAAQPGARDFGHTFPLASRLCQRVADGHVPKRFTDSAADVTAACDTLHSAYDAAVAAAPDTTAAKQAIADAKASVKSACLQTEDRSSCRAAIQQARASLKSARSTYRDGVKTYHQSIRAARRAFWTTVKGLRGGRPATDPTTTTNPTDDTSTTNDPSSTAVDFPGAPATA